MPSMASANESRLIRAVSRWWTGYRTGRSSGSRDFGPVVAAGAAVQTLEALFPSPVPGVKPGFANALTLVALSEWGMSAAFRVTLGRVLTGGLYLGTLFTPSFLMSLSGALVSFPVMAGMYRWARIPGRKGPGLAGVSVAAALAHNAGQIAVATFVVLHGPELFALLPVLIIGACAAGWVTGWFASSVIRKIGSASPVVLPESLPVRPLVRETGPRGPALTVLVIAVFVSVVVTLSASSSLTFSAALALASIIALFLIDRRVCGKVFVGILPLTAAVFLLPLFFQTGGVILAGVGHFNLTAEGLTRGSLAVCRLLGLSFTGRLFFRFLPVGQLLGRFKADGFWSDAVRAFDLLPGLIPALRQRLVGSKDLSAVAGYFAGFFQERRGR